MTCLLSTSCRRKKHQKSKQERKSSKKANNKSSSKSNNKPDSKSQSGESQKTVSFDADRLVKRAKKHIGTPYRSGGHDPGGFDCSGFVRYLFKQENIDLPPNSAQQASVGKEISESEAREGDLIFFTGANAKSRQVGHVGVVISEKGDPISFIHASSSKGIMISQLSEKYFKVRFIRLRRVK